MRSDALQGERDHLPADLDDLIDLRRRIIGLGETPATAAGVLGWLLSKKAGEPDVTGSDTRARYRKILARLEAAPTGPGRGERGLATVTSLAAFAAAAAPVMHAPVEEGRSVNLELAAA